MRIKLKYAQEWTNSCNGKRTPHSSTTKETDNENSSENGFEFTATTSTQYENLEQQTAKELFTDNLSQFESESAENVPESNFEHNLAEKYDDFDGIITKETTDILDMQCAGSFIQQISNVPWYIIMLDGKIIRMLVNISKKSDVSLQFNEFVLPFKAKDGKELFILSVCLSLENFEHKLDLGNMIYKSGNFEHVSQYHIYVSYLKNFMLPYSRQWPFLTGKIKVKFSLHIISAILREFSNISLIDYLNDFGEVVSTIKLKVKREEFSNQLLFELTRFIKEDEVLAILQKAMLILTLQKSWEDMKQQFTKIIYLLSIQWKNSMIQKIIGDIQDEFEKSNLKLEDFNRIIDYSQESRENTKFFECFLNDSKIFKQTKNLLSELEPKIAEENDDFDTLNSNEFFNNDLLDVLISKFFVFAPLWIGIYEVCKLHCKKNTF